MATMSWLIAFEPPARHWEMKLSPPRAAFCASE